METRSWLHSRIHHEQTLNFHTLSNSEGGEGIKVKTSIFMTHQVYSSIYLIERMGCGDHWSPMSGQKNLKVLFKYCSLPADLKSRHSTCQVCCDVWNRSVSTMISAVNVIESSVSAWQVHLACSLISFQLLHAAWHSHRCLVYARSFVQTCW